MVAALANAHSDVRKEIQRQYDRWSVAYMSNDLDTLLDILSPDYTLTTYDRDTMKYGAYVSYLKLRKSNPRDLTQYGTRIKKLATKGPIVEVDAIETMTSTLAEGRGLSIHRHEYLDRWKHSDKGWRLQSTTTVLESTTTQKR